MLLLPIQLAIRSRKVGFRRTEGMSKAFPAFRKCNENSECHERQLLRLAFLHKGLVEELEHGS